MGSTDEARETIRRRLDAVTGRGAVGAPGDDDHDDDQDHDPDRPEPGWLDPVPATTRVRLAPGRRGIAALALVASAAAGVGAVGVWRDRPEAVAVAAVAEQAPPPDVTPTPQAAPPAEEIVVSVVGLVHTSGLVHLPEGSRVADALQAAGGARDGADLLGLNLAQKLADGDQVLVGLAPPPGAAPVAGSATVGAGAAAGAAGAAGAVNLNTATEDQLDALPGVGPVTAAAIVGWRTTNGRFTDVEQLGEVDGIGPARLEKLRDLVTAR